MLNRLPRNDREENTLREPVQKLIRIAANSRACRKNYVFQFFIFCALCITIMAGISCGPEKDPVLEVLAARADYDAQLKGFTEKLDAEGEAEGVLLSIFVVNNSKRVLPTLTVRLRSYAMNNQDVPKETIRVAIDVSDIATNRSDEKIVPVAGFLPGLTDALALDVELAPAETEYGEFAELADAVASRGP